jgi:hypothetical protein
MFRTQDKRMFCIYTCCIVPDRFTELRELVYEHIVHDIKRMNLKHKNNQLNRTLQNFMCASLLQNVTFGN